MDNQDNIDDDEKIIEIVLSEATFIQESAIKMDKVITFSDEGIFREKN